MKQCPKCNRTYDDSQSFCLMDGTPLSVEIEQVTQVIQQQPAPKKSKLWLWLGLAGLLLVAGSILITGLMIFRLGKDGDNSTAKRQNNVNIKTTPKTISTTKPTPAPDSVNSSLGRRIFTENRKTETIARR